MIWYSTLPRAKQAQRHLELLFFREGGGAVRQNNAYSVALKSGQPRKKNTALPLGRDICCVRLCHEVAEAFIIQLTYTSPPFSV